jgi:NADP-dependent 3-hydroxy acid dehydrogenase YdfG
LKRLKGEYGGEIYAIPSDVGQMVGIEHLASEIAKCEEKVDVLINNAGVAWGASLDEFPEHGWDKVMDVNVKGRLLPDPETDAAAAQVRQRGQPGPRHQHRLPSTACTPRR